MTSPTQWTWIWVNSRSWYGQGCLAYCSLWGHKELDMIEWLNWTGLNDKKHRGSKEPLDESEKGELRSSKTKIMASGPITSWQINGEAMETGADFIFLSPKIIVDSDCSHEIKQCLLLRRKAITDLCRVLKKQRHYFATKACIVKVMVFLVVR